MKIITNHNVLLKITTLSIGVLVRQRQANLLVSSQTGLQSVFQENQGYTESPFLKKLQKNK